MSFQFPMWHEDMSMEECQALDAMLADSQRPTARSNSKDGKIKFVYKGQDWTLIPKNVTHVRIDPSMKRIKDGAFSRCSQLGEGELERRGGWVSYRYLHPP